MRSRHLLLAVFATALAAALAVLALLVHAPAAAVRGPPAAEPVTEPSPAAAPDRALAGAADPVALSDIAWATPSASGRGEAAPPADAERRRRKVEEISIPRPREYEPSSPQDARRYEVHRIYNRREFEAAGAAAKRWLEDQPEDREMLRIAASAACILGKRDEAADLLARMVERDRRMIRNRCARHGIVFDP